MADNTPISCNLDDHLKEIFTRQGQCCITYRETAEQLSRICGQIIAIYAVNGADWCQLDNGKLICLDLIEEFES